MFDYDEDLKKAAETLDKYDFTPILKRCYGVDIYDIEDWIKDYGDDVAEAVENLADYELADYLHQKYGMGIQEVSRYCAWWNDRKARWNNVRCCFCGRDLSKQLSTGEIRGGLGNKILANLCSDCYRKYMLLQQNCSIMNFGCDLYGQTR